MLVKDGAGREFHVLFGQAPESADGVGLTTSADEFRRAEGHAGPAASDASVWMLVAPRDREVRSASLDWIRDDGSPGQRPLDVTLPLVRPSEAVVLP